MTGNVQYMLEPEGIKLLKRYNIDYPGYGEAKNPLEAKIVAEAIGFPVIMKVISPDIYHKSEAGGVITNLVNAEAVQKACNTITESVLLYNPKAHVKGFLISKYIESSFEFIVGAVDDEIFGPTIMFGLGGIFTEILDDVSFRICPVDERELKSMIKEIRGYPLLKGIRGQEPFDINLLIKLLENVSNLIMDRNDITEIDLNPIRFSNNRLFVLDVKIFHKANTVENM